MVFKTTFGHSGFGKAHARSLLMLRIASSNPVFRAVLRLLYKPKKILPTHCFGLDFDHPFGIAAGMDKRAEALRVGIHWACIF